MFDFWESELTDEEAEALIEKAANEIGRRKLQAPAILALEMHKPLAGIGGHAALAFAPFLVPLLGYDFVNNYSRLLSKRENVEKLLNRLESKPNTDSGSSEDSCPT